MQRATDPGGLLARGWKCGDGVGGGVGALVERDNARSVDTEQDDVYSDGEGVTQRESTRVDGQCEAPTKGETSERDRPYWLRPVPLGCVRGLVELRNGPGYEGPELAKGTPRERARHSP